MGWRNLLSDLLIVNNNCFILRALNLGEYVNRRLSEYKITRLWLMQIGIIALASLSCLLQSTTTALSALLGGLVAVVPNIYFGYRVFKYQGARRARDIVNSFYKAEAIKVFVSMFLFAVVFVSYKVNALAFFSAYIVLLMTQWLTPWVIANKKNRAESD